MPFPLLPYFRRLDLSICLLLIVEQNRALELQIAQLVEQQRTLSQQIEDVVCVFSCLPACLMFFILLSSHLSLFAVCMRV